MTVSVEKPKESKKNPFQFEGGIASAQHPNESLEDFEKRHWDATLEMIRNYPWPDSSSSSTD